MSLTTDEDTDTSGEPVLRDALRAPGLSADALERVRRSVTAEWQLTYGVPPSRRRARRLVRMAAVAATIAAIGGFSLYWVLLPEPVVATVANGLAGSLRVGSGGTARGVLAGEPLRRGDQVVSEGTAELRWLRGGIVRMRPGSRFTVVSDTDLRLTAGTLYVDLAASHQAVALRVLTPFGTVEHVGTQFMVAVDERALDVGVREGAVRVRGAETTALAAGDALLLNVDGSTQRRRLESDDPQWRWIGEPLVAFDPEGRSVLDLLQWVAQEKGRTLAFAEDSVRRQAASTVLHGSIRGLSVDEAMDLMLATTTLNAVVREDHIDVQVAAAGQALRR